MYSFIHGRLGDKWNNTKYIRIYYTDNVAYVKVGNEISGSIEVTEGLRHCCSLSPILLIIYLEQKTLDHWKNSCQRMGLTIEENKCQCTLKYADESSYNSPRCKRIRIYF